MYLVTGGSGFCGLEIVRLLAWKGQKVRVLDVEPMPVDIPGVDFIHGDVRDKEVVQAACRGVHKVIHTVAKVPISKAGREFFEVNVDGTRNVLDAAWREGSQKVVHVSSSAVQFSKRNPVPESDPYNPVGIYAKSKMEAEKVCKEFADRGYDVSVIRPRTVIGPGRLGIFDILFDWIRAGKTIYIIGSGANKIQFLHSEDLAICCCQAADTVGAHVFNVGSRGFASLREGLQALITHAGSGSRIVGLPVFPTIAMLAVLDVLRLSPLASWHYLTYHKDFYFTNAKAKEILGWEPRYDNQEIITIAYDHYLSKGGKDLTYGKSHRYGLKQGILGLIKKWS